MNAHCTFCFLVASISKVKKKKKKMRYINSTRYITVTGRKYAAFCFVSKKNNITKNL